MVAIEGKNFCSSASKALKLIIANIVRVAVLDTISTVLIALSIFVIVGGVFTGALFFFYPEIIAWDNPFLSPPPHNPWVPLVVR